MNVKRFVGRNAREAMAQVRATWGDEAVVLSNRPVAGGVEILALPAGTPLPTAPRTPRAAVAAPVEPMSTLSFERYVRERQQQAAAPQDEPVPPAAAAAPRAPVRRAPTEPARFAASELREALGEPALEAARTGRPVLPEPAPRGAAAYADTRDHAAEANELLMSELRAMRGMISSQLASLSWFDSVRRSPAQTRLLRRMLSNGFSPALARHLVQRQPEGLGDDAADAWLHEVLRTNLRCASEAEAITDVGGRFALVGAPGVGKTTTAAKIAAQFAARHGAASVAVVSVDPERGAAGDPLRAFGQALGLPVQVARDTASLCELLALFEHKRLVLVDTGGLSPRDERLPALFELLPAEGLERLLVLHAAAQAETLEEVVHAYGAGPGTRCVLSRMDEAARCGVVVDLAIRRKLRLEGLATGQRVPQDWQPASAGALAARALAGEPDPLFTPDDAELGLWLTAPARAPAALGGAAARHA